jgi:hypothetical protein
MPQPKTVVSRNEYLDLRARLVALELVVMRFAARLNADAFETAVKESEASVGAEDNPSSLSRRLPAEERARHIKMLLSSLSGLRTDFRHVRTGAAEQ